jgi:hypothetical protein
VLRDVHRCSRDMRGDMCSRDVHRCSMIVGDLCSRDVHRCSGMCVVIGAQGMIGDMCSRLCIGAQGCAWIGSMMCVVVCAQ